MPCQSTRGIKMIEVLGWIILGALIVGAVKHYWNDIRSFLNSTALDAVEKHLGYNARLTMEKAVSKLVRIGDMAFNTTIIKSKKNKLDRYYDKTTIEFENTTQELSNEYGQELLNELAKADQRLEQTFEYTTQQ